MPRLRADSPDLPATRLRPGFSRVFSRQRGSSPGASRSYRRLGARAGSGCRSSDPVPRVREHCTRARIRDIGRADPGAGRQVRGPGMVLGAALDNSVFSPAWWRAGRFWGGRAGLPDQAGLHPGNGSPTGMRWAGISRGRAFRNGRSKPIAARTPPTLPRKTSEPQGFEPRLAPGPRTRQRAGQHRCHGTVVSTTTTGTMAALGNTHYPVSLPCGLCAARRSPRRRQRSPGRCSSCLHHWPERQPWPRSPPACRPAELECQQ